MSLVTFLFICTLLATVIIEPLGRAVEGYVKARAVRRAADLAASLLERYIETRPGAVRPESKE